ncbi:MAG: hypothetical protein QOH06_5078 [Acidobacteriota bacterium]|jgi:hypothetical protein|nr:hypothetical protein [Acidobacteriota bacterium]
MWVIFQKSDGRIVSASADSEIEMSKEAALKEVVPGVVGAKDVSDYDAIQVKDLEQFRNMTRAVSRGMARVRTTTAGKQDLVDDSPDSSVLFITTNAEQFHPVDNVPLIPADGASFLVVTLQKQNEKGEALSRKTIDTDVIWLRTDHGFLREDADEPREKGDIRSVKLVSGTARFRIYSGTERRLATVQMLTTNPELQAGGLRVEFI